MGEKYFMHRIQEEGGNFSKGIEIHDTLNSAILSFWGRVKLGYSNPQKPDMNYMSCKITDINGNVVRPYDMTWVKDAVSWEHIDKFFLHHIRLDGETFSKDIDICSSFDVARSSYAGHMEYGYNNPKHPNVKLVSCEITDAFGNILQPFADTWKAVEKEPDEELEEAQDQEE